MKRLLWLLLLSSCNKTCYWELESTQGNTAHYSSYRIQSKDAAFSELNLEFFYFQGHWTGFINLPSSVFSSCEAELFLQSPTTEIRKNIPILEGRQKAFLSEEIVLFLLDVLTQEESLFLSIERFQTTLPKEGLASLLQKIPTLGKE